MTGAPLRHCPVCGTDVDKVDLGMRDWTRWIGDLLPGKIAPMDIDFMLERHGKFLCVEFKGPGARLGVGQEITLRQLHKKGVDVWVLWEGKSYGDPVQVIVMNDKHRLAPADVQVLTVAALRRKLAAWYKKADEYKEEV